MDKDEILRTVEPSDDIPCRTCKYKLEPVESMGKIYERYKFAICHAFKNKPMGILWHGEECELYTVE